MNSIEFIYKAKEVHGDFYIYDETEFIDWKTKVKIIDKEYGAFYILPRNHLTGQGCPQRKYKNRANATEKFINKLKERRPDFEYDISKLKYIDSNTKVICICHKKDEYGNEHGEFEILPHNLLNQKDVCKKCYIERLKKVRCLENETFINNLKQIYGDTLTYDDINYVDNKTPVRLYCRKEDKNGVVHGFYEAIPRYLMKGNRCCKKCEVEKNKLKKETYKQDLIQYVNNKCSFQLENEDFEYINNTQKINCICHKKDKYGNEHGNFTIKIRDLKIGHGCPKCGGSIHKTNEEFLRECYEIHGDKYQYLDKYVDWKTKLRIVCPEHGIFYMSPNKHISRRQGCPLCNRSKLETEVEKLLKDNHIRYEPQKRFEWLGKQSLDFYLPDYNIAIECQGEQHFNDVLFFNNISLEQRIELDERKFELCKEHNIDILYFTNIKIGEEFLKKHKYYFTNKELLQEIKNKA